jgi:hypothetical protein
MRRYGAGQKEQVKGQMHAGTLSGTAPVTDKTRLQQANNGRLPVSLMVCVRESLTICDVGVIRSSGGQGWEFT